MKKIQLGKSGLHVSQLGFGCINFGTTVEESKALSLIDCYLDMGGNLLDTSNNYAVWNSNSTGRDSEKVIGKWLSLNPQSRKDIILSTKLGALTKDGRSGFDNMQGNSRSVILEEVEKSLDTLKTDYIDLLYLHVDDHNTPQEETMEALAEVISKGLVREIGCSNFMTYRIERARRICEDNGLPFFCAVQQRNSYFKPAVDADFGVQEYASREMLHYIDTNDDLSLIYHTSLLYGAYLKKEIEMEEYDTAYNRKKLEEIKSQTDNPVSYVLRQMVKERPNDVILFTSSDEKHMRQNINSLYVSILS